MGALELLKKPTKTKLNKGAQYPLFSYDAAALCVSVGIECWWAECECGGGRRVMGLRTLFGHLQLSSVNKRLPL